MRPSERKQYQQELLRIMLRAYDMGQKNQDMELRELIQEMSLQLKDLLERGNILQDPHRQHQGTDSEEGPACRQIPARYTSSRS